VVNSNEKNENEMRKMFHIILLLPPSLFMLTASFSLLIGPCSEKEMYLTTGCKKFGEIINHDPHWAIFIVLGASFILSLITVPILLINAVIKAYAKVKKMPNPSFKRDA